MLSITQYINILKNPNPTKTIMQESSPILIEKYEAIYLPEFDDSHEGVMHSITYENVSDSEIVAIKFGLLAFDAFNHLLDKFSGISLDQLELNQKTTSEWTQNSHSAWMFKTLGVGVVYIDAVRFKNNKFWYSDNDYILSEIQKIEKELNKDDLKDKKK